MVKIFYYDDETENLFAEEDAEATTLEEAIDELFNLADDDVSYVGFVTPGGRYKIRCDDYDSYKFYRAGEGEGTYVLFDLGNFEKCKAFITEEFEQYGAKESLPLPPSPGDDKRPANKWLPPGWQQ